jgi:hypothetical protein
MLSMQNTQVPSQNLAWEFENDKLFRLVNEGVVYRNRRA